LGSENNTSKTGALVQRRWLTPVILATQEIEIRRITVPSQPRQIALSQKKKKKKKTLTKKGLQVGPEFKSQNCKKKKKDWCFVTLRVLRTYLRIKIPLTFRCFSLTQQTGTCKVSLST
jgi:hypothetical protein